jgi:predicted AAA+ superfamily ATPase
MKQLSRLDIFERMHYCFRISPYGHARIRSVKKEQKLYQWDWSMGSEPGPGFENFIASHLLKYCHFMEDTEGTSKDLRFLSDTDRREADFVVTKEKKPLFAVECKTGEKISIRHCFISREGRASQNSTRCTQVKGIMKKME